ncbi:YggS family pyridoxal phosphate-dependent enzyme [Pseudoclavibacter sp. CFCC 13611]|uniref:YggS family pyridoxal phosphate-dependent enzyme n=1 Tax=Pseudoclavibacter sp. CFCC 13611 TaxID=2615178 RepID=UPI001CE3B8DD|nr:YggS family pyridoxal phosphate-dependent enzyme [Pseudoclavibacter sp. CFCC 13611]
MSSEFESVPAPSEPIDLGSSPQPEPRLAGGEAGVTERLRAFESDLQAELSLCGRRRDEVQVIVVTKYHTPELAAVLSAAGQRDFGENTLQGLHAKLEADPALASARWHFIGQLQRKKAGQVARLASAIHSIDRPELVDRIDRIELDHAVDAFVQVSLDGQPDRGGVSSDELDHLVERVLSSPHLRLEGLMAVAPLGEDADQAFERLQELSTRIQRIAPEAQSISAGMSGDWQAAIRHGATHLRIGTAITGKPVSGR